MRTKLDAKVARRQLDDLGVSGKATDVSVDLWRMATLIHDLQRRVAELERPAQTIGWRILQKMRLT